MTNNEQPLNHEEPAVDEIADVTDESVSVETLVVASEVEAEQVVETAEENLGEPSVDFEEDHSDIEDAADTVASDYVPITVPLIHKSFRGYNMNQIDNFVLPLVDRFNEMQSDRLKEKEQLEALKLELEANKEKIAHLESFTITDEVKKVLAQAAEEAKEIVVEAHAHGKEIIEEARAKKNEAVEKAKAKTVHSVEKAAEQSEKIKEHAKTEAEKIIAKAKAEAEKITAKVNDELAEAKEYIAKRHEVHSKLQDFYKAQGDFLANRG